MYLKGTHLHSCRWLWLSEPFVACLFGANAFLHVHCCITNAPLCHYGWASLGHNLHTKLWTAGQKIWGGQCSFCGETIFKNLKCMKQLQWLLTLLFGFYVFLSSIEDSDTFGKPLVYFTLTSKYNAHVLINVHYFFLLLVICISLADYMLIRMNRRIKIR